jgi:hypothetical protein
MLWVEHVLDMFASKKFALAVLRIGALPLPHLWGSCPEGTEGISELSCIFCLNAPSVCFAASFPASGEAKGAAPNSKNYPNPSACASNRSPQVPFA